MRRSITAHWLGRVPYERAHTMQQALVQARVAGRIGDVLLLLEHDPVITLGRGGKRENLVTADSHLRALGVSVVETGRGGDVTFHGPGQLVAYPIFDLKPDRCDVRRYVRDLADVMIGLAADSGIRAGVIPGAPKHVGVWVDAAEPASWDEDRASDASIGVPNGVRLEKLGAIGVRLSRWVTMHGFALNVSTDLRFFDLIVPCGIRGLGVASLSSLGRAHTSSGAPSAYGGPATVEAAARASHLHFARVFDADVREATALERAALNDA